MPVVVIVGGGFARLSAAKALKAAPVRVLLIDRVVQWSWTFLTGQRGSRLIVSGAEPARAADAPQRSVTARSA
jgi:2-polyprenyl-6-methoxyphenol hydroxylase-like FAD-dependent oxidoreductase